MDTYAIVWTVLMILFLVVEAVCPFHLVCVWFAVGSLVAMLTALLGGPLWLQAVLFLVVSSALLVLTVPLVRKFVKPAMIKTNVDAIIGTRGHVTETIDNIDAVGKVKLGGMEWTARSYDGQIIPAGTLVQVEKIEGVKAFVTAVKEEARL